jgi:(p)ppGpp synthase/HD superfamily hydrolase
MTQKFKTLSDVVALAEFAHRNQVDKAGLPYIEHPKRVLQKVQAQGGLPYVQMAAILHDVTEDTAFTPEMLLELGVPEGAVEIVRLVDRHVSVAEWRELHKEWGDHESFPDPDTYYYDQIRKNEWAVQVKLADIEDNLSTWRLTYLPQETQDRLKAKYAKAIELLTGDKHGF